MGLINVAQTTARGGTGSKIAAATGGLTYTIAALGPWIGVTFVAMATYFGHRWWKKAQDKKQTVGAVSTGEKLESTPTPLTATTTTATATTTTTGGTVESTASDGKAINSLETETKTFKNTRVNIEDKVQKAFNSSDAKEFSLNIDNKRVWEKRAPNPASIEGQKALKKKQGKK